MIGDPLRILLVDDVPAVLSGMSLIVRRLSHEARVFTACNGEQALLIAQNEPPDIVVTDIRMPVMDGLVLCQKLRELGLDSAFVIMSGYEDFDYAKKAIDLGVKKYVLKPVDPVFFTGILSEIISSLLASRQDVRRHEDSYRLARQRLLLKLMGAPTDKLSELSRRAEENGIRLLGERSKLILVQIDGLIGADSEQVEKFQGALSDFFGAGPLDFVCEEMGRGQFAVLVNLDTQAAPLALDDLQRQFAAHWGGVRIGGSALFHGSEGFTLAQAQAQCLVNHALVYGSPLDHSRQVEGLVRAERLLWARISRQQIISIARQITMCFEQQLYSLCQRYLQILSDAFGGADWEPESLRAAAVSFSMLMNEYLITSSAHGVASLYKGGEAFERLLLDIRDTDGLKGYCSQLIDRITNRLTMGGNSQNNFLVSRAIQAIHSNLEAATLHSVSERLGISPVYLSMLFKEQTGVKFKDYLTTARIERAKQLLREPASRIHAVSLQLGYADAKYFCKLFKKITGMSPSTYKALTD